MPRRENDLARPRFKSADDCPDKANHTPHPRGYQAHACWAEGMVKSHYQKRCPTCGFLTQWVPKR